MTSCGSVWVGPRGVLRPASEHLRTEQPPSTFEQCPNSFRVSPRAFGARKCSETTWRLLGGARRLFGGCSGVLVVEKGGVQASCLTWGSSIVCGTSSLRRSEVLQQIALPNKGVSICHGGRRLLLFAALPSVSPAVATNKMVGPPGCPSEHGLLPHVVYVGGGSSRRSRGDRGVPRCPQKTPPRINFSAAFLYPVESSGSIPWC